MSEWKKIVVVTTVGEFKFEGKHRPDLEKPNWHYYERSNGKFIHFRKEHMVLIDECSE